METTTEPPTKAPERLFQVTSTITLREELDGRTRRYDGVPVVWEMVRSPEEAPFDVSEVVPTDRPEKEKLEKERQMDASAAASLFTREEALRFLNDLEEEHPEGEHRLQSVPTPASEKHLRYGPGASQGYIEASSELGVSGDRYLQEAERKGWEEGETHLVETTWSYRRSWPSASTRGTMWPRTSANWRRRPCGIARLSSGQQLRSVSVGFASRCSRIECTVPMSQPLQVNLSEEQREELIDVRDHHDKPYMREKAAAVLKVAGSPEKVAGSPEEEGQSARQVALSGLLRERSPKAVRDWVHTYKKEGIDGFAVEEGRGQKPAFSPEQ